MSALDEVFALTDAERELIEDLDLALALAEVAEWLLEPED